MLRVSAVNELPALSWMREAGALDCGDSSEDRRVAAGPGPRCSRVSVGVRTVVIAGDPNLIESPGGYLGGSIVLVEPRRVRERRLRPQAGCHVQPFNGTPVNAPRLFGCATEADLAMGRSVAGSESPTV